MPARGFTLLELLVTLTVLVLLVAVGIPSMSQQIRSNHLKTATLDLYQAVQLARTRAVTTNSRVTMRALGDWHQGWRIFLDPNHNGTWEADEFLIAEAGPNSRLSIHGNLPVRRYISFIGTGEGRYATGRYGGAFQAGTLTLCPAAEIGEGYQLVLARSGRMRRKKIGPEEC